MFREAVKGKHRSLEIDFIDARFLPVDIIDTLAALRRQYSRENLKIHTCYRILTSYLRRIHISNSLLQEKKTTSPSLHTNIGIIAMGGSAGSLEKIISVIKRIPLSDITMFIIQHIGEGGNRILDKLLQSHTPYKVLYAAPDVLIQKRTLYIAPPGYHTIVVGDYIYLTQEERVNYSRPSIDVLFESLSIQYGPELMTILFCGYGRDGTTTMKSVKENNSTVIVETPDECEAGEIPENAILGGAYDYIMSCNEISEYISSVLESNEISAEEKLNQFLASIYDTYGYDFRDYQRDTLKRRIGASMANENFDSFDAFKFSVLSKRESFERLFYDFSINTTTFFRNPLSFKMLRDDILPYLASYHHIKIWCAGCSSGEEAYSVSIILKELGLLKKSRIYATDFNTIILENAKNGIFPRDYLNLNENNYIQSGGEKTFSDYFEINKGYVKIEETLKERILFFNHSLVSDGVFNEFQLIICRNVLIYFNKNLQNRVLELFKDSLDMSGFLMLGESENILPGGENDFFNPYNSKNRIYKKSFL